MREVGGSNHGRGTIVIGVFQPTRIDSAVSYSVWLVAEGSRVRGSGRYSAVMWRPIYSSIKSETDRTRWLCVCLVEVWGRNPWLSPIGQLCVWVTLCGFNGSMRCVLPWEWRCVLGGNRSEPGIIKLHYSVAYTLLLLLLLLLYEVARPSKITTISASIIIIIMYYCNEFSIAVCDIHTSNSVLGVICIHITNKLWNNNIFNIEQSWLKSLIKYRREGIT